MRFILTIIINNINIDIKTVCVCVTLANSCSGAAEKW